MSADPVYSDYSIRIIYETDTEFYVSNIHHEMGGEIMRVPKSVIRAVKISYSPINEHEGDWETLFTIEEDDAEEIGLEM